MSMSDRVVSYLRTAAPVWWGWLLVQLAAVLPTPLADALATSEAKAAVTAGVIFVWYALWRWLEPRIPDWVTRLVLGSAQAPAYKWGTVANLNGAVMSSSDLTPGEQSMIRDLRLVEGRDPDTGAEPVAADISEV